MIPLKVLAGSIFFFLLSLASSCTTSESKFRVQDGAGFFTRSALLRGEVKEAVSYYESAAQAAEKAAIASWFPQEQWKTAALAYTEASSAARLSGELEMSLSFAQRALAMAERSGDLDLILRSINNLISAYTSVRQFDMAKQLLDKGFLFVEKIPPNTNARVRGEGSLYRRLGLEMMRQGRFEKAINAFSESLALWRSYLSYQSRYFGPTHPYIEVARTSILNSLMSLGDAYRRAGKSRDALEHYQAAAAFIKETGIRYANEGILHQGIGEIHFANKEFHEALESFGLALALAEKQGRPASISSASRRVGDVLSRTGRSDEAIPSYEKAIRQIEATRSLLQSQEYRQSFFEGGLATYISMIGVLSQTDKAGEAFSYSERARSRAFLDLLGSKAQLSRSKGGLLEEERTLQERIAAVKAQLSGDGDEATNRTRLDKELAAGEQAYNAFLSKVRSQDKEQASLMSVEPLTLKQVQELIEPAQTLIEYFVISTEVFAWVLEKDKLNFQRMALSKNELAIQVKSLREMISNPGNASKLNEVSNTLYKSLIQPLLPQISGKELIIVPHDVLHYLPFQVLIGPDGHYLVEKYPINYLSSASLLQFVKEKRTAGRERVLAFGNPYLGDPEKNLEFAELEAQEVKSVYPQADVFVRKQATEEKSKSLSGNRDILHFATHAELNENDPLSSAVLLAKEGKEDGRLEVREIFGMDLKANLVVLSGCDTALGKLSTGDELVGLTRAFIYAGTPSVVASLWKIDDSSTAHLMSNFYRNLKTMTKVEALRQAQLAMIRGTGTSDLLARRGVGGIGKLGETPVSTTPSENSVSTSHPYFWAPFILVGDGK